MVRVDGRELDCVASAIAQRVHKRLPRRAAHTRYSKGVELGPSRVAPKDVAASHALVGPNHREGVGHIVAAAVERAGLSPATSTHAHRCTQTIATHKSRKAQPDWNEDCLLRTTDETQR